MDIIRMAIYKGQNFVDSYDVDLDDSVEKHMRYFIDAVSDEGGTRVRITQRDPDDDHVKSAWTVPVDEFFEQSIESLIEELVEERLLAELNNDNSGW